MIQGWISDCVGNHAACRKTVSGGFVDDRTKQQPLPTRLVEVSPVPRLRETAGQAGQYFALSYCWGSNPAADAITTAATVQAFQQKIPMDVLSPTVRDAILLVQRLGYQYLWVDALCIIQGDHEDWKRESQQMSHVYENALGTIVALGAGRADDGLFFSGNKPNPPKEGLSATKDVILPCTNGQGKMVGHASFSAWPRFDAESRMAAINDFLDSRWKQRGWVLQERMLSRRMIYFGQHQIYWTCSEKMYHEDGISHRHPNMLMSNSYNLREGILFVRIINSLRFMPMLRRITEKMFCYGNSGLGSLWQPIICDYARCDLTAKGDKLMAIAGLATAFVSLTGLTYFEGIWTESACFDLAWSPGRSNFKPFPDRGNVFFKPNFRNRKWTLKIILHSTVVELGVLRRNLELSTVYLSDFLFADGESKSNTCLADRRQESP